MIDLSVIAKTKLKQLYIIGVPETVKYKNKFLWTQKITDRIFSAEDLMHNIKMQPWLYVCDQKVDAIQIARGRRKPPSSKEHSEGLKIAPVIEVSYAGEFAIAFRKIDQIYHNYECAESTAPMHDLAGHALMTTVEIRFAEIDPHLLNFRKLKIESVYFPDIGRDIVYFNHMNQQCKP